MVQIKTVTYYVKNIVKSHISTSSKRTNTHLQIPVHHIISIFRNKPLSDEIVMQL